MSKPTQKLLVIKKDRLRAIAVGFMGLCLVAAGIICLVVPMPYVDELSYKIWIGGFGTVMGTAALAYGVATLTKFTYKLRIDERGIDDHSNWMSPGFIAWDEVKSVYILELGHNTYLSVDLNDPEAFTAHLNPMQKRLVKANTETGFSPVRIQLASFTDEADTKQAFDVVKAINPKLTRGKVKIKAPTLSGKKAEVVSS